LFLFKKVSLNRWHDFSFYTSEKFALMKRIIQILLISISLVSAIPNNTLKAQDVDINVFYNTLSPYGRWIDYGTYGRVWICSTPGFIPYETGGHWAYTDYGWTWVSDYNWGWAPFHYGRWAYDNAYGWIWVPGYEWAPAWVAWRSSGDYYGWAPLAPGVSISVTVIPAYRWCFVPVRYITSPQIHNYYMSRSQNVTIINKTTVINNTNVYNNARYVSGPRRADVERTVGKPVTTMHVNNSSRPGTTNVTNNTVNIYRPVIRNNIHTAPTSGNANVTPNRPPNNNSNHHANETVNRPPAGVNHHESHVSSNNDVHANRNAMPEHNNPAPSNNHRPQNINHTAPQPAQREMHQQQQQIHQQAQLMHQPEMHQQPRHQHTQPMQQPRPQPPNMPHAQPQPMPHQEGRPQH
jgi:hypothetical protein